MARRVAGFAVVVALCGMGCGADEPGVGSWQGELTEATPTTRYAPVGWLVAEERWATVPEIGDCSATLIGARTILAAGHCQQRRSSYTFYLFDEDGKKHGYQAKDLRTPDGYALIDLPDGRGQHTEEDLALLTLRKTPPLSIPRASLTARTPQELAAELGSTALSAHAVGLGPEQMGGKQRLPHRTPVLLPESDDTAARHGPEELWMPTGAAGFGHFVKGDSGGPTVVHLDAPAIPAAEADAPADHGRWVVVGVHSQYRVKDEVNVDTPMSAWLAWIRESAAGDLCEDDVGPVGVQCSGAAPPAAEDDAAEGEGDKSDGVDPAAVAGCAVGGEAAGSWPAGLLLLLLAAIRGRCAAARTRR